MVKTLSLDPSWINMLFRKGQQTPPLPQTPCIAYGKGKQTNKTFFFTAVIKMYSNEPKRNTNTKDIK